LDKKVAKVLHLPTDKLQEAVDDIFKLRVADSHGMTVLRVAREEIIRRRRLDTIERIARGI